MQEIGRGVPVGSIVRGVTETPLLLTGSPSAPPRRVFDAWNHPETLLGRPLQTSQGRMRVADLPSGQSSPDFRGDKGSGPIGIALVAAVASSVRPSL